MNAIERAKADILAWARDLTGVECSCGEPAVVRKKPPQMGCLVGGLCWRCWYDQVGAPQAIREWRAARWWRRLVP